MKIRVAFKIPDVELFDVSRLKGIKIINAGNFYSRIAPEQSINKIAANKTGAAGDQIMLHSLKTVVR